MNDKDVEMVEITIPLAHPKNINIKLIPGRCRKDVLIRDLGQVNYDFAVKEGWIKEDSTTTKEKGA